MLQDFVGCVQLCCVRGLPKLGPVLDREIVHISKGSCRFHKTNFDSGGLSFDGSVQPHVIRFCLDDTATLLTELYTGHALREWLCGCNDKRSSLRVSMPGDFHGEWDLQKRNFTLRARTNCGKMKATSLIPIRQ